MSCFYPILNMQPCIALQPRWDQPQKWWHREFQGEYIFPLTQDNHDLIEYLKKQKFLPEVGTKVILFYDILMWLIFIPCMPTVMVLCMFVLTLRAQLFSLYVLVYVHDFADIFVFSTPMFAPVLHYVIYWTSSENIPQISVQLSCCGL